MLVVELLDNSQKRMKDKKKLMKEEGEGEVKEKWNGKGVIRGKEGGCKGRFQSINQTYAKFCNLIKIPNENFAFSFSCPLKTNVS